MSKYKVGDKVFVRRDLKPGFDYGGDYLNEDILETPIVTIRDIITAGGDEHYVVEENSWAYNDDMFISKVCDYDVKSMYPSIEIEDNISHPSHYTDGKIEVIDFIEDKKLGFHLGNVVKYVARAGKKNPDKYYEDLKKASWYLNREIEKGNKDD